MTLSAASAAEQRSSSAKLEALLAKLAVRKLELDKVAADAADNVIAKVVEPVGLDLAIARLKWAERSRR